MSTSSSPGDIQDNAILCPPRSGAKGVEGGLAASVMLLDCLDKGGPEAELRAEMRQNQIRRDALEIAERAPALAA